MDVMNASFLVALGAGVFALGVYMGAMLDGSKVEVVDMRQKAYKETNECAKAKAD